MTVAIPEAAVSARAGSTRRPQTVQGTVVSRRDEPPRGSRARTGSRGQPGSAGATGPRGAPGRQAPAQKPQRQSQSRRRQVPRRLTGPGVGSPGHNYQGIIAAEYVAATLLVAISPIATRKAQATPTSGKLSPYVPADIIKIVAIGVVYLILEGLAAGPRGLARFSAWFGALILLAVGLSELARLAQIFRVISGAEYQPVKLTAADVPATRGGFTIGALGQAAPSQGGGHQ